MCQLILINWPAVITDFSFLSPQDVMRRIAARAGLRRGQSPAKAHRSAAT